MCSRCHKIYPSVATRVLPCGSQAKPRGANAQGPKLRLERLIRDSNMVGEARPPKGYSDQELREMYNTAEAALTCAATTGNHDA